MIVGFKKVNPRTIEWETRDCVVRASTIATGLPYDVVHSKYKAAGRKDKKGTPVNLIGEVLDYETGFKAQTRRSAQTLNRFLAVYKTGRWVMCNSRHAWAVIDGVVHDDGPIGARTKVLYAWRIKE